MQLRLRTNSHCDDELVLSSRRSVWRICGRSSSTNSSRTMNARTTSGPVVPASAACIDGCGEQGLRPASDSPEGIRDYVRHAFEISEGLRLSSNRKGQSAI